MKKELTEKGVIYNETKLYNNPALPEEEEELELDSLFEVQGGTEQGHKDQDCGLGCYTGGLL